MKERTGDLIQMAKDGDFDVIIHGCNCFCNFGAGIAKQIKREFPEAYAADCETMKGDASKIGSITYAQIPAETDHGYLYVVNAYTQNTYGRGMQVDYDGLTDCFVEIARVFGNKGYEFGYPLIGCGLAGGDWNVVKEIIDEELAEEDHTLVNYGG